VSVVRCLKELPRPISFIAKENYLILPLVEVYTQSGLHIGFTGAEMRARNVVDVEKESSPFRVCDFNKLHICFERCINRETL
jgi:hypothetical protein